MQENDKLNPEELQTPKLATVPITLEAEKLTMNDVSGASEEDLEKLKEHLQETLDDHDKKNYKKVTSTLYIQPVKNEDKDDEEKELFKILNPETDNIETRELTDEEKKEVLIQHLKESRIKFHPTKNPVRTISKTIITKSYGTKTRNISVKTKAVATNETVNQFNTVYKKKRKRKNKLTKTSRKANR